MTPSQEMEWGGEKGYLLTFNVEALHSDEGAPSGGTPQPSRAPFRVAKQMAGALSRGRVLWNMDTLSVCEREESHDLWAFCNFFSSCAPAKISVACNSPLLQRFLNECVCFRISILPTAAPVLVKTWLILNCEKLYCFSIDIILFKMISTTKDAVLISEASISSKRWLN